MFIESIFQVKYMKDKIEIEKVWQAINLENDSSDYYMGKNDAFNNVLFLPLIEAEILAEIKNLEYAQPNRDYGYYDGYINALMWILKKPSNFVLPSTFIFR
jgi:hypothetical protein